MHFPGVLQPGQHGAAGRPEPYLGSSLQVLARSNIRCDFQVYYNPDNTVLRGRPQAWLRGGWNRWTHARTFPPQPMQPGQPGGTGFLQSTVEASALH